MLSSIFTSYALVNNILVQLPSGWRHAIERATCKDRQPFGSVMPDGDDTNGSRASSVCGACRREQVSSSWMVSVLTLSLRICLLTDETRMTNLIIILYLIIATDRWDSLHLQGLGLKVPAQI